MDGIELIESADLAHLIWKREQTIEVLKIDLLRETSETMKWAILKLIEFHSVVLTDYQTELNKRKDDE